MLDTFVKVLLSTGVNDYVATHDWVWPVCEIIHFFGMFMLIGSVGLIDLRILGVGIGPSAGLTKGMVDNIQAATEAIVAELKAQGAEATAVVGNVTVAADAAGASNPEIANELWELILARTGDAAAARAITPRSTTPNCAAASAARSS